MRKRHWLVPAGGVVGLLSLAVLLSACGSDREGGGDVIDSPTAEPVTVDVIHKEWELTPSVDTVPAGTVTFDASNDGSILHNFRLARTDLEPAALPLNPSTFMVDEDQLEVVAESEDLGPGDVEEVTVDLAPGHYVVFCNVPGHFEAGLYAGFTVE